MTIDSKPALLVPTDLPFDTIPDSVSSAEVSSAAVPSAAVPSAGAGERGLTSGEQAYVIAARQTAFTL